MPGSVSDSYDPEFGTGENAGLVEDEVTRLRNLLAEYIGDDNLFNIVELCRPDAHKSDMRVNPVEVKLSVRELRVLRFALNRALESL